MLKAVLCDLDGTLLDSNALHAECWQRAFEHFGFPVDFLSVVKQIGKGSEFMLPSFIPEDRLPAIEKEMKAFRTRLFYREYIDRIVPFCDARRLLERMRREGLRIAVATSSEKKDLEVFKTVLKIHDLIEEDVTASDTDNSKPEPDIFLAALSALKLKPEEALALGDTPWDIQAATKAGVRTVAVLSGGWKRDELEQAGALAVFVDVADILRNFEQSPFVRD